jgi:hypothetical protein
MARIDIKSAGGASLDTGILQLENGVAMDATLRKVTDQSNTASPLKLSTTGVQTTSKLQITTADTNYIDAEDNSGNNRFTVGRDPASQQVNVDFASNPTGSTTIVGAIRTYQDGVNLSEVLSFREDGQATFSERVNIEADSLVTTQSSSVIAASTTNANLIIAPNGTGALIADIPNGAVSGGNARGANAVDLQTSRSTVSQVASGANSSIVGGETNTSSGASSISGGSGNTASGSYSVALGYLNQATSTGNISLGFSNTVSGNTSMAGPRNCVASGEGSVALGFSASATGGRSYALGSSNTASGGYSVSLGAGNNAYNQGMITTSMTDAFTTQGDCQRSMVTERLVGDFSTGGTGTLDITAGGSPAYLIPSGNNRAWNVQVNWVAIVTSITGTATGISVGDVITSVDLLAFKKIAGVSSASTHTSAGTKTMVTTPASYVGCQITYSAGTSQRLDLVFTAPVFAGGGTINMRVVATLELTEVAY